MKLPTNFIPANINNIQNSFSPGSGPYAGNPLNFTGNATNLLTISASINSNTINQQLQTSLQSTLPSNIDQLSDEEIANLQPLVINSSLSEDAKNRLNQIINTNPETRKINALLNTAIPTQIFSGSIPIDQVRQKASLLAENYLNQIPKIPDIPGLPKIPLIPTIPRILPIIPTYAQIKSYIDKRIDNMKQKQQEAFIKAQENRVAEAKNPFTFRDSITEAQSRLQMTSSTLVQATPQEVFTETNPE